MPSIRFPASAVPLLPLCKGHGENFIFRTYADFIAFLAAYGFHRLSEGCVPLPAKPVCVDAPNAIDLEVFSNRALYSNLLIMALAHDPTRGIAENETLLSKFIEQVASLGADALSLPADINPSWTLTDIILNHSNDRLKI